MRGSVEEVHAWGRGLRCAADGGGGDCLGACRGFVIDRDFGKGFGKSFFCDLGAAATGEDGCVFAGSDASVGFCVYEVAADEVRGA